MTRHASAEVNPPIKQQNQTRDKPPSSLKAYIPPTATYDLLSYVQLAYSPTHPLSRTPVSLYQNPPYTRESTTCIQSPIFNDLDYSFHKQIYSLHT